MSRAFTLMRNMDRLDLLAGTGLTVVDPHGSLAQDLLDAIPRERLNNVIYLKLRGLVYPAGELRARREEGRFRSRYLVGERVQFSDP